MEYVVRTDPDRGLPPILHEVLMQSGWLMYDEEQPPESQPKFNLWWRTNRFTASQVQSAKYPYQRINHYPKCTEITKKDTMGRHLKRMRVIHGSIYDFTPTTFIMPNEYVKFAQFFSAEQERNEGKGVTPTYIAKPSDLSRGRKIYVFREIHELTYDCPTVVQTYVDKPLLIHGHKVDFRVYVLVTCFQPLRAYIYDDCLARFSVEKYDLNDITNIYSHLTNYSINKNSKLMDEYKDGIGFGCKWHMKHIREYFNKHKIDFSVLWTRVENLVSLTLLSIAPQTPQVMQCFCLYGFDVIFDEEFKPWLLEVNASPALSVEGEVDDIVKRPLMRDLVATLHMPRFERPKTPEEDEPEVCTSPTKCSVKTEGTTPPDNKEVKKAAPESSPLTKSRSSSGKTLTKVSQPFPNAVPRISSSVRSSGSTSSSLSKAIQPHSPAATFVDKPEGNFRWCFPFSPETQAAALELAKNPEVAVKLAVAEVKKREAKLISQSKEFAEQYRQSCAAAAASKAAKTS